MSEVLLPDKLYNELKQELSTPAEKVALHQDARSAVGKKLGLDVGTPSEVVRLANSQMVEGRDYIGLALDTRLYAKRDCSWCYGRGTVTMSKPVPIATALSLVKENPANEALLHQSSPGKYITREATMCTCAKKGYRKKHAMLANALVQAGLARYAGVRVGPDGHQQDAIELL